MNLFKCAFLSAAVLCASTSVALEVSGHNDIKGVNAGLEQRMQALRASLTAAFDSLKTRVDTFDTRITANRTDINTHQEDIKIIKANGANNEVQRWNPRLEARLDSIETVNTNQTAHINYLYNTDASYNSRITILENKPAGAMSISVGTDCSDHAVGGSQMYNMILCPAPRVVVGLQQSGLATGAKIWSGVIRCCNLVAN